MFLARKQRLLIKLAEGKRETYPISRFFSSPLTSGATSAAGGTLGGLLLAGGASQRAAARGMPLKGSAKARLALAALLGGALGGGLDGGIHFLGNKIRARALKGKAAVNDPSFASREEKQIIKLLRKK